MNIRKTAALLLCLALVLSMLAGCGAANTNNAAVPENNSNVENSSANENTVPAGPTEEELSKLDDIAKAGAQAVAGDKLKEGSYDIKVASGSALFKVLESKLVVVGNIMQLVLKVEGDAYSKMYAGSASEAASAQTVSEGEVDADGNTTFRIVIKSLNEVLKCSAYADAPGKWYDRTILADAESLDAAAFKPVETADDPGKKDEGKTDSGKKDEGKTDSGKKDEGKTDTGKKDEGKTDSGKKDEGKTDSGKKDEQKDQGLADGDYTVKVTFSGGTGKAKIVSPATLHVKNGKMTVTVQWSSKNYDYMKVNGTKYMNENKGGNSVFTFPVSALGKSFTVIGDTTAMSTPHEIEYTLRLDLQ
ncbi:MAG: hypothetical protein IJM80_04305 [Firmicutes bacterium]|nr:hypothetical protein [Bacillota bacterium]